MTDKDKTKVVRLILRSRPVADENILLPYGTIKKMLETGKPEMLWGFFQQVSEMPPYRKTIHDKEWLKLIVNFVPTTDGPDPKPKFVPESEKACWYPLAKHVHMLREVDGATMTLSRAQADMVWERFVSPDFKLIPSQQFKDFMLDFAEAAGKNLPGLQKDQDFEIEVDYPEMAPDAASGNGQRDEPVPESAA